MRGKKHIYSFDLSRSCANAFDEYTKSTPKGSWLFAATARTVQENFCAILDFKSPEQSYDLAQFMASDADITEYTVCLHLYDEYVNGGKSNTVIRYNKLRKF